MYNQEQPPVKSGRFKALVLFMLFAAPFVLAQLFFSTGWRPGSKVNNGTLVSRPLRLENLALEALVSADAETLAPASASQITLASNTGPKWKIVYLAPSPCLANCEKAIHAMRQIRLVLGKEAKRVERLVALGRPDAANQTILASFHSRYPSMRVSRYPNHTFPQLTAKFELSDNQKQNGLLFLADPNDNLILYYPGNFTHKDVYGDLKHLLKYSHIG